MNIINETPKRPLYIFDLDGTVSSDGWRKHLLPKHPDGQPRAENDGTIPHDAYDKYHSLLGGDMPMYAGFKCLKRAIALGAFIVFFTARPTSYHEKTVEWLEKFLGNFDYWLYMRDDDDLRGSVELKLDMLSRLKETLKLSAHWHLETIAIYDDRADVLGAIGSTGINAFRITENNEVVMVSYHNGHKFPKEMSALHEQINAGAAGNCDPNKKQDANVKAIEETKTIGDISIKTRTEFVAPANHVSGFVDKPESLAKAIGNAWEAVMGLTGKPVRETSAADLLDEMAATFRERNKVYGNNEKLVGDVMSAMFPNGVTLRTAADFRMWHLFELKVVKLTRFAVSGLQHQDSIHDDGVYSAMCERLVGTHNIQINQDESE